jgi:anti-sigma factor RsiW
MMTHDEVSELLGAFALDAVEHDEYDEVEAHLAECPRCRAEVDAHREVAAALGNSIEPLPEGLWDSIALRLPPRQDEEAPPMPLLMRAGDDDAEGVEARTETGVFRRPRRARAARTGRTARPSRSRLAAVGAVAVAAAAAAIVLGVNLVHDDNQISQLQQAVGTSGHTAVEAALHTPGSKLVNVESPSHQQLAQFVVVPNGQGYLVKSKLPALSPSQTYQLWGVIGRKPISLGLLGRSPTQGASYTAASSRSPSSLAVTVEPAGGSVIPTAPMLGTGTA